MATVDLRAVQDNANGTVRQALADSLTSGDTIGGSDKLLQRFLILLGTTRGTVPYLPLQGCHFFDLISRGIASEQELITDFSASLIDLGPQMRAAEAATDPLDEQYKQAVLEQVIITDMQTLIQVRVDTKAGTSSSTTWPLMFDLK